MYKSNIQNSDDLIYYNINITNPNTNDPINSTFLSVPCIFSETRTQPILNKPDDYVMSVIRFSLPGANIPLFIFPVIPNPDDPNDINFSSLTVSISYMTEHSGKVHLVYNPHQNITPPSPTKAFNTQQSYLYYSVYNYQDLIDMYNVAIQTAFESITTPEGAQAPYFQFNASLERIELVAQQAFYDQQSALNPIYLYINYLGIRFFIGLNVQSNGNNLSSGEDYTFIVENTYNNWYNPSWIIPNPSESPKYLIMQGEFNALTYWNDLSSVVFMSGMIPVRPELTPNINNNTTGIQGNANRVRLVTDFIPNIGEQAGDITSKYVYNPSAEYRIINLTSQAPLTDVDIAVKWQDANNNLFDIFLLPGQVCTIKIVFIKKSARFGEYNK